MIALAVGFVVGAAAVVVARLINRLRRSPEFIRGFRDGIHRNEEDR